MIHTCRVSFICSYGSPQAQFRAFCRNICGEESHVNLLSEPVFSYGRSGRARLAPVRDAVGRDGVTIAYLCDIPGYAAVLIATNAHEPVVVPPMSEHYPSFDAFERSPKLIGYYPLANMWRSAAISENTIVVSIIPESLMDEETDRPAQNTIAVLDGRPTSEGTVVAYRVLDRARYFQAIWSENQQPVYFLGSARPDLSECLAQYEANGLTEYLDRLGVSFGTLYDCHQDDGFAVSYREDIWHGPAEYVAFMV